MDAPGVQWLNKMELINFDEQHDLYSWAANKFSALGEDAIKNRRQFDVALSGGSTAQAFFKTLAKERPAQEMLSHSAFFVSDERAVPLTSADSNAGNAWRMLLDPLGVLPSNYFPLYDGSQSPALCAHAYEQKLKGCLPLNEEGIPIFDLIYLGIGEDGHTASLFPHSALLIDIMHNPCLVQASGEPVNGHERITFMPKLILSARHICVMAPGAGKARIIDRMLHEPLNCEKWPAQLILRSGHPGLTLLLSS